MNPHVSFITLGVGDLNRARQFYSDGLGWPIQGHFVSFRPADGSSALTLYPREVLADDAGVPPDGSGFRGVTFSYISWALRPSARRDLSPGPSSRVRARPLAGV